MAFTMTVADLIDADTSGMLGKHATWERVPLSEIANVLNGAPFDSASFSTTEGMPLVRIRDVTTGQTSTYYTGHYEDEYLVQQGDLLVGMDGDFNSGFWGSDTALLNQRVCKITPLESFYDKRLLAFTLPGYLAAINANTPSVTVKHLSSKTIGEIGLPLPPRTEQTRIVAKIEELLSDLDAGVAELKVAQKKLAQYRQSLLQAAVEGALTAEWRAKNMPAETSAQLLERIQRERRARWEAKQLAKFVEQGKIPPKDWQKKYSEPVLPDTSDLPDLPEGWVWASVDQLSPDDLANGRSVPTADTGAKVLRLTAIKEGIVDLHEHKLGSWSEEDAKPFAVTEDDLLIVRGNGSLPLVGRAGLVGSVKEQVAYPDTMIRLRVVESVVSPAWIGLVWDSHVVRTHLERRARTSAGIYKIAQSDIVSAVVPVPSLLEQTQIREVFALQLAQIAATQTALETSLKQSTAQRQNILRAAFAGQLVPQDPNDEPASVLLERIRAERAERAKQSKARKTKPKEIATVVSRLIDVLAEAGDWVPAQEAFRRCGVAAGALTEHIEELYAELRKLDKAGRLAVEAVTDEQGRKLHDKLKLLAG